MLQEIKLNVKKVLAHMGLMHPSLGIKIGGDEKVRILLVHRGKARIFIETGTSLGNTVEALKNNFERIYSIEFDRQLYEKAKDRFPDTHISVLHGDSAVELKKVLSEISEPALIWLDAHDSGEINASNSPVIGELEAIFSHPTKKHTILIDDARHFDRVLIKKMNEMARYNDYTCVIKNGIFILLPK